MKRIAIVHIAHWDQLRGGAETQLEYLSTYFIELGHDLHFIYPIRNTKEVNNSELNLHPLKFVNIPGFFGKGWFFYKSQILRVLKSIKPDVIITRGYSSWAGIAANYANKFEINHIHFIASDSEISKATGKVSWNKPFDYYEKGLYRNLLRDSSILICQNLHQHREYKKKFNQNTHVITQAAPKSLGSAIKKSRKKTKVVWVANLKPLKQPQKFLQIVDAFKNTQNIEFIMIGGYSDLSYKLLLDSYSHIENFSYLGALSNDQVNDVLNTAHILINTSEYEGFSNTFVQAWLREVVVLSFNSNPNNILTEEEIGFLTHGVENSIKILKRLLCQPQKIAYLGQRSRAYALKFHTFKPVYEKIEKFL